MTTWTFNTRDTRQIVARNGIRTTIIAMARDGSFSSTPHDQEALDALRRSQADAQALFVQSGITLFGEQWKNKMHDACRVGINTPRYWLNGKMLLTLDHTIFVTILELLDERAKAFDDMSAKIMSSTGFGLGS